MFPLPQWKASRFNNPTRELNYELLIEGISSWTIEFDSFTNKNIPYNYCNATQIN